MTNDFRWSKDNKSTWNYVANATLPYNLAGVLSTDTVIVEAIGPDTIATGVVVPGPANTRNWTAARFAKTTAGIARVRAGTGRMRIACGPGDSTTAGVNATRQTSGPAALAARLATLWGVPVSTNSILGAGGTGTTAAAIAAFDSRISYTGSPVGSAPNYGGSTLRLAVSGESWTWSLTQCDTIEFYLDNGPAYGTYNFYIDGALYGTNPASGVFASLRTNKITITGLADTAHTVKVEWVSGTTYFLGPIGMRSTVPAVDVINGGWAGSKSTDWNTSTGVAAKDGWLAVGADLTLIVTGINDENFSTDPTTGFTVAEAALVDYGKSNLNADVLLVVPTWWTGGASIAAQQAYEASILAISDSKSVPCYDFRTAWASWAAMNSAGLMGGNTIHPNATGYSTLWTPIADSIFAVVP